MTCPRTGRPRGGPLSSRDGIPRAASPSGRSAPSPAIPTQRQPSGHLPSLKTEAGSSCPKSPCKERGPALPGSAGWDRGAQGGPLRSAPISTAASATGVGPRGLLLRGHADAWSAAAASLAAIRPCSASPRRPCPRLVPAVLREGEPISRGQSSAAGKRVAPPVLTWVRRPPALRRDTGLLALLRPTLRKGGWPLSCSGAGRQGKAADGPDLEGQPGRQDLAGRGARDRPQLLSPQDQRGNDNGWNAE